MNTHAARIPWVSLLIDHITHPHHLHMCRQNIVHHVRTWERLNARQRKHWMTITYPELAFKCWNVHLVWRRCSATVKVQSQRVNSDKKCYWVTAVNQECLTQDSLAEITNQRFSLKYQTFRSFLLPLSVVVAYRVCMCYLCEGDSRWCWKRLVFQRKSLVGDFCKRTLSDATQLDKLLQQCLTFSIALHTKASTSCLSSQLNGSSLSLHKSCDKQIQWILGYPNPNGQMLQTFCLDKWKVWISEVKRNTTLYK